MNGSSIGHCELRPHSRHGTALRGYGQEVNCSQTKGGGVEVDSVSFMHLAVHTFEIVALPHRRVIWVVQTLATTQEM